MSYVIEVSHDGLHKYRVIRGTDRYVVQQKAAALNAQWDAEWERKCEVEARRQQRIDVIASREASKQQAIDLTEAAREQLEDVRGVLAHALQVDDRVDWESLKDRSPFAERPPASPARPVKPIRPAPSDAKYKPKRDLFTFLFTSARQKADALAQQLYHRDIELFEAEDRRLDKEYETSVTRYEKDLRAWERRKAEFEQLQADNCAVIDERKAAVEAGDRGAVIDFMDLVLTKSVYPGFMNVDFELDYEPETGAAIVEFELPAPADLPTLSEVRYVQSRDEFAEKHISEAEAARLYDSLIYQIALRTLHELFEADEHRHLTRITFNGWVSFVDRATGADRRACIVTVGANRPDFEKIDLSRVDPKECFKSLKGVAAAKLVGLAPVAPLDRIKREDSRFIDSVEVLSSVDQTSNLAAMDWKEFEQLVRQVFEAEFAAANGEVHVTQASRDGGVDAVIFDPDPIRGGKIIVQAKRYTNTVEVSSVRDLYGTVVNEGATKGILVTTAQFGPDARKFAQDKPITLIDGGNLLYLLEKMGVKARIDLREAKQLLASA